jgi:hypothetical protein
MRRSVLLGVVLAGVLAGCSLGGGSGAGTVSTPHVGVPVPPTGRVTGLVVTEGGPAIIGGSDIHPVKNALVQVTGTDTSGVKVEKHLTCDSHGRFSVSLNPGRYTFLAQIFPANPTHPRKSVVVERGQNSRIVLKGYLI